MGGVCLHRNAGRDDAKHISDRGDYEAQRVVDPLIGIGRVLHLPTVKVDNTEYM